MIRRSSTRLYAAGCALLFLTASPARAQFSPRPLGDPPTGEEFIIEASAGFWNPSIDATVSSESLGIPGSIVDLKRDLGVTDQRFGELHAVFRPTRKQKLRFQFIPIKYEQRTTLRRDIVFNGQLYRVSLPVNSSLDWKAYRFAYEYDFIARDWGFAGVIVDFKYTDVQASLVSTTTSEFTRARAPVPALGGIVRFYVVPNISITGELTGIKVPDSISEDFRAHYADLDIYGTVNFTNNVGAQLGFRRFDVGYLIDDDAGSFELRGLYFGAVVRY
jgi:hypothetical protein